MTELWFDALAPFLRRFVFERGWTELRPLQEAACSVLFDSDNHLILAAGTASGKTEAALFPVLSLLHTDPAASVGALYIGPTKALINDQFERLAEVVEHGEIPVWAWHGDIAASQKRRLVERPAGVLQITPESLESLLVNRPHELSAMFGDLRFVIIDEVHAFMGSQRGLQILCQLKRLERSMSRAPKRIGLSATLGDTNLAEEWLSRGTEHQAVTPKLESDSRQLRLRLEYFGPLAPDAHFYDRLEHTVAPQKVLVFANSRSEVEDTTLELRRRADAQGLADVYHTHHSAVSASVRKAAEAALKDEHARAVVVATSSLEVGIDIGALDRVVQCGALSSVSTFLQRLGRSGRRGKPSEMALLICEPDRETSSPLAEIAWDLLSSVAVIELYLREKWIEPIRPPTLPFSLLFHQTLSTLVSSGPLSAPDLARAVLTLPPFEHVSQEHYRVLLRSMLDAEMLERTSDRRLIIGKQGERLTSSYSFYAVFANASSWSVIHNREAVGQLAKSQVSVGDVFVLAGRPWEVSSVDNQRMRVYVRPSSSRGAVRYRSRGPLVHTRIVEMVGELLREGDEYRYLTAGAKTALERSREIARDSGMLDHVVLNHGNGRASIVPWLGSRELLALRTLLRLHSANGIRWSDSVEPYFLGVELGGSADELRAYLAEIASTPASEKERSELARLAWDEVFETELTLGERYNVYVPEELLQEAFARDELPIDAMQQHLQARLGLIAGVPTDPRPAPPNAPLATPSNAMSATPSALPANAIWVNSDEQLLGLIDQLRSVPAIALDVETSTSFRLCLVQLATDEKTYLIDALALPDLAPLAVLFSVPRPVKVIHNAQFERQVLARHDIEINGVFDTLKASRHLRPGVKGGHSLAAVCERELGRRLNKTQQCSDWSQRPLSAVQLRYAALDAEVLLPLYRLFRRELAKRRDESPQAPIDTPPAERMPKPAPAEVSVRAPRNVAQKAHTPRELGVDLELVDPSCHALLKELAERGVPMPSIGYEAMGSKGAIVAQAELAWGYLKLAVVLDGDPDNRAVFEHEGWQVLDAKVHSPEQLVIEIVNRWLGGEG